MTIDGKTLKDRFAYGFAILIILLVLAVFLGTGVGRWLIVFAVLVVGLIYGLGWTAEAIYRAYEEYTE